LGVDPGKAISYESFLYIKIPDIEFGYASAVSIGGEGMDSEIGSISYYLRESLGGLGSPGLVRFRGINASQSNAFTLNADGISITDMDPACL
jgi:hypothetical protein